MLFVTLSILIKKIYMLSIPIFFLGDADKN